MTLLAEIGEALYGERWQSALAKDLGVTDRTVRRWAAGQTPIPDGVWAVLRLRCKVRRIRIEALERALAKLS